MIGRGLTGTKSVRDAVPVCRLQQIVKWNDLLLWVVGAFAIIGQYYAQSGIVSERGVKVAARKFKASFVGTP